MVSPSSDYQLVQDLAPELRVRHLAPAEHDGDLDLGSRLEEPLDVALLRGVVVRVDLGAELDLLDLDPRLLLAGLLLADVAFVLVLAVVHDPAHRRIGLRRDLHEIQVEIPSLSQSVLGGNHPDLLTVGPHQTNLWRPDPVIDPRILRDPASPLSKNKHRSNRCADDTRSALLASQYRCRSPHVSTMPHRRWCLGSDDAAWGEVLGWVSE